MAKRRISRASKLRLGVFGTMCIIFIVYFVISLFYNVYTIYNLSTEKNNLEISYKNLQEEAEDLKINIEKLNDPKYLANYARENYLYSKDGEYIIQLGEDAKETKKSMDTISKSINKNYIIIGLSIFMLFIFIYILRKGRSKK